MNNEAPSITLADTERFATNKSRLARSKREFLETEARNPNEIGDIVESQRQAVERLRIAKKAGPEAVDEYYKQDIEAPIFP